MSHDDRVQLAGIEYYGVAGASKECLDAVMRLLQYGDQITRARILSATREHCLLLTVNSGDFIAVKSGFGSGYLGEGSHAFSYALQLLETHGAEIDEYKVRPELIERVDNSALTWSDLEELDAARPVRPTRWHEYVFEHHDELERDGTLWRDFPIVMPFAIIDPRIADLALSFWVGPDEKLLTGYRRLEDIVRARTSIREHGVKIFSRAFNGSSPLLGWHDIDDGEQTGRSSLFTGTYMAYRNRRAHRELENDPTSQLAEFLLLNHLFLLEGASGEQLSESAT